MVLVLVTMTVAMTMTMAITVAVAMAVTMTVSMFVLVNVDWMNGWNVDGIDMLRMGRCSAEAEDCKDEHHS